MAADSTVIASASGSLGPADAWIPVSISGLGAGTGDLVVELDSTTSGNRQPLFDNVQVQSLDASGVPEPATCTVMLLALMGFWRRRRSQRGRYAGERDSGMLVVQTACLRPIQPRWVHHGALSGIDSRGRSGERSGIGTGCTGIGDMMQPRASTRFASR